MEEWGKIIRGGQVECKTGLHLLLFPNMFFGQMTFFFVLNTPDGVRFLVNLLKKKEESKTLSTEDQWEMKTK